MVGLSAVVNLVLEEVGQALPERQAEVLAGLHRVEGQGAVELGRVHGVGEFDVPLVLRPVRAAQLVEIVVEDLVEAGKCSGLLFEAFAIDEIGQQDVVQGAVDGLEEARRSRIRSSCERPAQAA